MGPITKRKRQSRSQLNIINNNKKCLHNWKLQLDKFDDTKLRNRNGKVRSVEENQLILSSLRMLLDKEIELLQYNKGNIMLLTWTKIEKQLAEYLHVGKDYIAALRKTLFEVGEIRVFGLSPKAGQKTTRGLASPNYKKQNLLDKEQLCDLVNEVDVNHAAGRSVTNMLMRNYIRYKYQIDISRTTMGRYMKALGLSWKPIKNKKRNASAYRMDLLREYIIKFNDIYMKCKDNPDSDYVFVFTDESYIHRGHGKAMSYFREGGPDVNRKSSKGDRLVIMHAISPSKGPLCQKADDGSIIFDTEWIGATEDTPHSRKRPDGKLTCETIWKAESKTGDYHDNMNSEMFMKWVTEKLIPTFELEYINKKMVLICDNAAYHHKRELGSLASMKKAELVGVCDDHKVEYIDIPVTNNRLKYLNNNIIDYASLHDDEWIRVTFKARAFRKKYSKTSPLIPTCEELKYGMVRYFQEKKPELLECKVTKAMQDNGHSIIWTPPYSPHLQPIELFWAAGKNHAASMATFEHKNYDTVKHLREGWYGNHHLFTNNNNNAPDYHILRKDPCDCKKLFDHCVENLNTIAIPICPGIEGRIGDLVVDDNYENAHGNLPIDIFLLGIDDVLDVNSDALDGGDIDEDENVRSFGI